MDFAVRKQFTEHCKRILIVWIIECRHKHDAVPNIKIEIACREPLSVFAQGHGEREGAYRKWAAVFFWDSLEYIFCVLKDRIVWIARIIWQSAKNCMLVNKP